MVASGAGTLAVFGSTNVSLDGAFRSVSETAGNVADGGVAATGGTTTGGVRAAGAAVIDVGFTAATVSPAGKDCAGTEESVGSGAILAPAGAGAATGSTGCGISAKTESAIAVAESGGGTTAPSTDKGALLSTGNGAVKDGSTAATLPSGNGASTPGVGD